MTVKANARYPFPPYTQVIVCDGDIHATFNTSAGLGMALEAVVDGTECDGSCKGWFTPTKRLRAK